VPTLHGSCLCRGVRFEISGPLRPARNCHCSMCRKQQGAAFRSASRISAADLRWIQGEDLVKFYESSPGTFRGFCGVCGSPIINRFDERSRSAAFRPAAVSEYGVALATLDDDPAFARGSTSSSTARHHGLRSPTICLNTRTTRPLAKNAAGLGTATGPAWT
jgi:hypothetical protein